MLYLLAKDNLTNYNSVLVFLKEGETRKIEISGKIVSAESDSNRLIIQTETSTTIFNVADVISVKFMK